MENSSSLFSISIDPVTKTHLSEAAKWARFLAIVGIISLVLVIGFGMYASFVLSEISDSRFDRNGGYARAMGGAAAVVYVLAGLIYFFPLLYLLRFANHMKSALSANDQELLNKSFQNLKVLMRYLGIITIIFLVIFGLSFLLGILSRTAIN